MCGTKATQRAAEPGSTAAAPEHAPQEAPSTGLTLEGGMGPGTAGEGASSCPQGGAGPEGGRPFKKRKRVPPWERPQVGA
eukprot:scaffold117973_cov21-Tisochrysis_lutea.AAC.1